MNEIKKAFETFKKELAKEVGLKGGFTMSKRQIELRTATYLVNTIMSYDDEVKRLEEFDIRVQGYDTWTDSEKAKHHEDSIKQIEHYEAQKARFGSKANELIETVKMIKSSKAFAKLEEAIGKITLTTETKENFYNYIRFNY